MWKSRVLFTIGELAPVLLSFPTVRDCLVGHSASFICRYTVAAQVPEYTEKVKLSKSLILYLGFCFYGYFAAWKQRRKPVPCCQPAGDGPKPGDTHTLSHCLVLLLNSWQDFSQSFLRHLSDFPFGEEGMEDGSHGWGHRQRLQSSRSTRLPSPWAFCPGNAGKQVPGTASAGVRAADPSSTVGENDGKHMMAGCFLQVCVFLEYITCFDDKCGERAVFIALLCVLEQMKLHKCCYFDCHMGQISLEHIKHHVFCEKQPLSPASAVSSSVLTLTFSAIMCSSPKL